jgi:predicted extracellular nuclease
MNRTIVLWKIAVLIAVAASGCKSGKPDKVADQKSSTVLFYNVENLFDVEKDPVNNDADFTPEGKLQWTEERLNTKLSRIAEVVTKVDSQYPVLIGLCEVENRKVLEMLVSHDLMVPGKYGIVHRDSPDERGIDVALLYRQDRFTPEAEEWLRVDIPDKEDPFTRDILYVKGKWNGESVHVFVNHWPSRSGGQAESEYKRVLAAQRLAGRVDEIFKADPDAKVICMGDFNDHPTDKSVKEVLRAGVNSGDRLFNMMSDDQERGEGSHWYKGEWGALDQIMVSPGLLSARKGLHTDQEGAFIFRESFLMFTDNQGQARPNRTYAGEKYVNGYSDHLPVYLRIAD